MKNQKLSYILLTLAILLGLSSYSRAQISSPAKDWGGLTQYNAVGAVQDSVFVFFSSTTSPKKGTLKAQFPDGSLSNFIWYKFDVDHPNSVNHFLPFDTVTGVTVSTLTNLVRGGYKVSITRISDNAIVADSCWVMIDDVAITNIEVDNNCSFLYLNTRLQPNRYDIVNDYFTYWDLSKSTHPEISMLGGNYFKKLTWNASNSLISVSSITTLTLLLEDPAPSYDSKYDIQVINPFGRKLTYETELLPAKAPKADFKIYTNSNGTWSDGGAAPTGEAPLTLKLESKTINADSIYWQIKNDETLFLHGGDSLVWRDSALFTDRIESYPTPEKMIPGTYPVTHIAVKVNSGCRDTVTVNVVVDTSGIKPDAIPNVFSPNGDGTNEYFKIKQPETNVSSIKSFHVYIFGRAGQRVYDYSGDPKTWEGWNGKIEGSKGDAPEGVYFYIIEAVGWDNKKFNGGKYKGFFYLYRGK